MHIYIYLGTMFMILSNSTGYLVWNTETRTKELSFKLLISSEMGNMKNLYKKNRSEKGRWPKVMKSSMDLKGFSLINGFHLLSVKMACSLLFGSSKNWGGNSQLFSPGPVTGLIAFKWLGQIIATKPPRSPQEVVKSKGILAKCLNSGVGIIIICPEMLNSHFKNTLN